MIHGAYIRTNRILAGMVLAVSFLIYFATMAPTVSYWDCGEFIATAYILGVPHPPGSPFFLILGRIFSMFPTSSDIAFRVNLISPIVSAVAVMLVYLIIVKFIAHWRKGIKDQSDALVAFGGALVGALTLAFSDSHWFNAVEAEVYSMSTFFTAIVIWLILHWSERADKPGNERYILIIAYMIGLATGVHLLNLLTLPFIALTIYFQSFEFRWRGFFLTVLITGGVYLLINTGIIYGLPKRVGDIGLFGVIVLVIIIFGAMIWSIAARKRLLSMALTSTVLILIGYSTYAMIFIRSAQDPAIDENNPETVSQAVAYMQREQYGQIYQFPRRYDGLKPQHEVVGPPAEGRRYSGAQNRRYQFHNLEKQWDYFWSYQVKKMYWRYFLWQFAGRGPSTETRVTPYGANSQEDGVDWFQFGLPLAFLLGLGGMVYHFQRDRKQAFGVLVLFLMTGLAVIVYLNQNNPQPRERDYSYVGSFLAYSIWIGIGSAALVETVFPWVQNRVKLKKLIPALIGAQLILVPGVMLYASYHSHDRSGNFVAWDYSYNILQSCEPNAILFTNGDNDTFPLWYLQEVEGIRQDVTVANLSLLNTTWYIKQLRDGHRHLGYEGIRFISMDDPQVDQLAAGYIPWKTRNVSIPVENDTLNPEGFIEWTVKPTFANAAIKVQDMMIMKIIDDARWRYPIYFAVTVPASNRVGLEEYLEMEGLVYRLRSHTVNFPQDQMNPRRMTAVLLSGPGGETWSQDISAREWTQAEGDIWSRTPQDGYLFRNLGNPAVYFNNQTVRLMQNVRSAYMQLAAHHYLKYRDLRNKGNDPDRIEEERQKVVEILDRMTENIPEETITMTSKELHYQLGRIYGDVGDQKRLKAVLDVLMERKDITPHDRIEYGQAYLSDLNDLERGREIFEDLYHTYQTYETSIQTRGLNRSGIDQKTWDRWQQLYSKIVSSLVFTYKNMELFEDAEVMLTSWLDKNPQDPVAKSLLEEIRGQGLSLEEDGP